MMWAIPNVVEWVPTLTKTELGSKVKNKDISIKVIPTKQQIVGK